MDVWRLTYAALRRWYVLLPALAVTGLVVMAAGRSVAPEYSTTGAAALMPPAFSEGPNNPYLGSSGAQTLQIILNGNATRSELAGQGFEPGYEVGLQSRSVIFQVSVASDDAERAVATGAAVLDRLTAELSRGQEEYGIPPEARATVQVLDPPATVAETTTSALRVRAALGLIGVVGSLALAICFDDLMGFLRQRRDRRAGVPLAPETEVPRLQTRQPGRTGAASAGAVQRDVAVGASGPSGSQLRSALAQRQQGRRVPPSGSRVPPS